MHHNSKTHTAKSPRLNSKNIAANIHHQQSLYFTIQKCCYYLFGQQKRSVIVLMCVITLTSIGPAIDSIFLQKIIDEIELYSDYDLVSMDLMSILFIWVIIYGLWHESLNIVWRIYDYIYMKTIPKIKAQLIDEFYNYIQYHDYHFFRNNLAGDITNRITEAARSIEMIFAYANEKILRKLTLIMFTLITLYAVNHTIALVFLIWIIFFIGFSLYFSTTINKYSTLYSQDKTLVSGKIVDIISNILTVRIFGNHRYERDQLNHNLEKAIKSDQKMQWFMLKLHYVLGISCTSMICIVIYHVINLRSNLEISIGQCVLIITLCITAIEHMWDLAQEFGDLFEEFGAFSQSMDLLSSYRIPYNENCKSLIIKSPSIEFKNVTFQYINNDNNFHNQSLSIKPYEKIGLVGFSGSGKTTFTQLITRIHEISDGAIMIDNQNITSVNQESLHQNISIIPQDTALFHRSIKENIAYGNLNASNEDIQQAAKNAHIHDVIMNLPEGYNSICGEKGSNLSGGQRQRIAIARSFLKNAPILILDEATNALDQYTENLIQKSLTKLMNKKTVLVITHKLSTMLDMDRIFVFNKGHPIEIGTHDELLQNGDLYNRLCKYS